MKAKWFASLIAFLVAGLGSSLAGAQDVTITPLGAVAGEFCGGDRALLFEDPTGVRVLMATGRTVSGSVGSRLCITGGTNVVLIDHPHVDHIGGV